MIKFRSIIAAAMFVACGSSAFAQGLTPAEQEAEELGYSVHPYGFIQLQGGLGTTFTNTNNLKELLDPTFSIGAGAMFTPVVGARLHVNGFESSSLTHLNLNPVGTCTYKHKYLTTDIDVLVNLTNIFRETYNHTFNLYFVGGVGLNYSWDNDKFTDHLALHRDVILEDVSNAWGKGTNRKDLLGHNVRAGLLFDFNICKNFSAGAEFDVNSMSDRFNSKYDDADDWMMTAQLSLTYKFGHKKYSAPVNDAPVTTQAEYEAQAAATAAAAQAAAKRAEAEAAARKAALEAQKKAEETAKAQQIEPLKEVNHYEIRMSDPDNSIIDKVVAWCNKYPGKSVTVDGYADKGTGNPKVNAKYAMQRAQKVADALKAKGISADRIYVKSYGDTVQPYPNNDDNRCVIIVGE